VLKGKIENASDTTAILEWVDSFSIISALTAFEAVLGAELSLGPLYIVTQKAGYDTGVLVESGAACFPGGISAKVPEAVADLEQGTKCIAFELFTAAGFHLHGRTRLFYTDTGMPSPTARSDQQAGIWVII
jgi:hypothetical protein